MSSLAQQRCLHHALREAVARCPECGHSYCRECITEHEDRVICAGCLKKILPKSEIKRNWFKPIAQGVHTILSFVAIWFVFFLAAKILLAIPSSFHEGQVWRPFTDQQ